MSVPQCLSAPLKQTLAHAADLGFPSRATCLGACQLTSLPRPRAMLDQAAAGEQMACTLEVAEEPIPGSTAAQQPSGESQVGTVRWLVLPRD